MNYLSNFMAWVNHRRVGYLWGRYTCSVRIYRKRFQRQHIAIQFFSCVYCVCSVIVRQGCITAACSALMLSFYSTLTETESSLNMKNIVMWVVCRAHICKHLRGPGVDSEESILPTYVAWRAGTTNRVGVPAHQAWESIPGLLKGTWQRGGFSGVFAEIGTA